MMKFAFYLVMSLILIQFSTRSVQAQQCLNLFEKIDHQKADLQLQYLQSSIDTFLNERPLTSVADFKILREKVSRELKNSRKFSNSDLLHLSDIYLKKVFKLQHKIEGLDHHYPLHEEQSQQFILDLVEPLDSWGNYFRNFISGLKVAIPIQYKMDMPLNINENTVSKNGLRESELLLQFFVQSEIIERLAQNPDQFLKKLNLPKINLDETNFIYSQDIQASKPMPVSKSQKFNERLNLLIKNLLPFISE